MPFIDKLKVRGTSYDVYSEAVTDGAGKVLTYQQLEDAVSGGVTDVAYDATNKKITKTIGSTTSDVVSVATIKSDLNLNSTDITTALGYTPIDSTEKGAASGVATLDSTGRVPSSELPSYVDDVIEGYYHEGNFYSDAEHTQLITPETGKIYVDLPTNKTYRWSGSTYVVIGTSLALGTTHETAYYGDFGQAAYEHSQIVSGNPHGTTAADLGAEVTSNKVTSLSSSSTDDQYPSAKVVYDNLATKQDNLPQVVNDRYLHTNTSTGALEWSEVEQGGGDQADFGTDDILEFSQGTNVTVMANPTGTASADLNKIKIDHTIYQIPQASPIKLTTVSLPTASWVQTIEKGVSGTTTITEGTVTVDKTTFLSQISTAGSYVFTYDGTNSYWTYNSSQVDLTIYGITYTGTPADANTITVTVTDNNKNEYSQTVVISGVSNSSKIDLQCDSTVINQLLSDGTTALYTTNNNGTISVIAVGEKPSINLTLQATISEVIV